MTNEEILSGNKLIAEFMGWKIDSQGNCIVNDVWLLPDCLKYHLSWDWLMPVVRKIEKVWWTEFDGIDEMVLAQQKIKLLSSPIHSPIDMIWYYCIQFITWHNKRSDKSQTIPN